MIYKNLIKLHNTSLELQGLKGSKWKFNFLLIEIEDRTEETCTKHNKELKTLQQATKDLKLLHCEKDKNEKAIIFYNEFGYAGHKGLALGECPEYDKEMINIDNQVTEINNTEIDIDLSDIKKIKRDVCPEAGMFGYHWKVLSEWIEDFNV